MANVYLVKRTSTNHQDLSLEAQDSALRKWCDDHGHTIAGESIENGVSGAKKLNKRSKTMKMISNMSKNDILAVYSLSRLSRSLIDLMTQAEILEKKGCHLVSLTDSIDTTSPQGRFTFHIFGAVAQLERELIAQRVKFGLDHKRSLGEKLGGRVPFGYSLKPVPGINRKGESVEIKTLVANDKEKLVIDTIKDMRAKQYTLKGICDTLNDDGIKTKEGSVWMPVQIHNILKRQEAA